jgi:predicted acyl esterase
MADRFTEKEIFDGEEFDVEFRIARRPTAVDPSIDLGKSEDPMAAMGQGFCPDFNQRTYEVSPGIICQQDVAVRMRDGAVIYVDIYRPKDESIRIPVIISWSWFGKRPGDGMSEWQIMGVPPGTVSKSAKFESPDPLYWCHYGYAVANVDARGSGHNEGNVHQFGPKDAEDGYDFIEWVALQYWCNGKVGMSGNSGVAIHQYHIAAQQPPHLMCIAPWESTTDMYRESIFEGGIPAITFNEFIAGSVTGMGGVEDLAEMGKKYPLMNAYWRNKIPNFKNVRIPVYAAAGMSHFHLRGTMNAFRKIRSRKKWIRIHRDFEWPDTYDPQNLEDLRRFYDRYLKDIYNGWEMTSRIRMDIMDAYDCDYQVRRPEKAFPLERTQYTRYYLDAKNMTMHAAPEAEASKVSYESNTEEAVFDMTFNEDTELSGYMYLHLFVEADGHNDMDMFINIQKADKDGKWIPWHTLDEAHPGAWGKIRVSHRELDEELSTEFNPVMAHKRELKLSPGEIVPIDVEIVPSCRIWHKGEKLRIQIAGRYIREGWFEPLSWDTDNHGKHIIHTGGQYESFIQVPVIPPKYQSGDYVYR